MAAAPPSSEALLLLLLSCTTWPPTPGSALLADSDHATSPASLEPHFTECISRDQETFRCWWSPGSFHNLSSPGALRVFYLKKDSPVSHWKECPEYVHSNRECFFDVNHTSVWIPYCLQLRSQSVVPSIHEEYCFTVENIVRPDPPVSLNWTQLNISPSGLSYDVMVSWEPPPSADVKAGWMRIEYELQYRERNATNWMALEKQRHTKQTIYGLQIGKEYEVHIRSRMQAFTKFGDFSDSVFIQVTDVPGKEPVSPYTLVVVFGILGIFIFIMLIVVSQQQKLLMVLLPPVPTPKINGIDPELLKKGKLEELNFILTGGGVAGLPTYAPHFYQDEPWVEFIEVDMKTPDASEKEDRGSDTQRLLGLSRPAGHRADIGCSNAIGFADDDSGGAGCSDAQTAVAPADTPLPGQADVKENVPDAERSERPLIATQSAQTWVNTDFYAQVSNVMPSGGVVLSPGQQLRIQESSSAHEEEPAEKTQKELQFQLLVVEPDGSGYPTENASRQTGFLADDYHPIRQHPTEAQPGEESRSPYVSPDSPRPQLFAAVADYTVVQEVNSQRSLLLLNPPPRRSPPLPQNPLKALPAMPVGYVTPDLLGNLTP